MPAIISAKRAKAHQLPARVVLTILSGSTAQMLALVLINTMMLE